MAPKPSPVRALRERLGLNVPEFAKQIGVAKRTVHRWQSKDAAPSPLAKQKMRELHQAHQAAQATHNGGASVNGPVRKASAVPLPAPGRPGIVPSRVPLRRPSDDE